MSVVSTAHLVAMRPFPVGQLVNMQNVVAIGHKFDIYIMFVICVSVSHHVGASIGMYILVDG